MDFIKWIVGSYFGILFGIIILYYDHYHYLRNLFAACKESATIY